MAAASAVATTASAAVAAAGVESVAQSKPAGQEAAGPGLRDGTAVGNETEVEVEMGAGELRGMDACVVDPADDAVSAASEWNGGGKYTVLVVAVDRSGSDDRDGEEENCFFVEALLSLTYFSCYPSSSFSCGWSISFPATSLVF